MTSHSFTNAHALIIGIANYAHARKLSEAVIRDAQDLAALLQSPARCGFDPRKVQLLLEGAATREAIVAALDQLAGKASDEDMVCIYFSGHGWRASDNDESYLLPVDGRRDALETSAIAAALLSECLNRIKVRRLLVLLDACHAGGAGTIKDAYGSDEEERTMSEPALELLAQGSGRAIIASSKVNETSLILPGARNSAFTTVLLNGLDGAADFQGSGIVKLFGLYEYIAEKLPDLTNGRQHPVLRTKIETNYAIALCRNRSAEDDHSPSPLWRARLQSLLPILYPAGPTDRDIWERAGGDLAELTFGKTGRSMWFEALKLLENGGGGDIHIGKLIAEALKDHPRNTPLLSLT